MAQGAAEDKSVPTAPLPFGHIQDGVWVHGYASSDVMKDIQLFWDDNLGERRLRWRYGNYLFEILQVDELEIGYADIFLEKQDLIDLVEAIIANTP